MPDFNAEVSVHDFKGANGIPFRARVVMPGDDYGRFSPENGWALQHDVEKPLVEFYDKRFNFSPHGQFISRYELETLQESSSKDAQHHRGLDLCGGVENWKLDTASLARAVEWAQAHVHHRQENPLDAMAIGYLKAAIFTTLDDNDCPMDLSFSTDSVGPSVRAEAKDACDSFCDDNQVLIEQALSQPGYTAERLGHDFWLTRNGHGTGFWDRDELAIPSVELETDNGMSLGDALTEVAQKARSVDLQLGDDGTLDFLPMKRKTFQP